MLRQIFQTHFKQNMFIRIIILFSIFTIVTVIILSMFIYQYAEQSILNRQLDVQNKVIHSVSSYISTKYNEVEKLLRNIYSNGELDRNLSYFLEHSYDEYVSYQLDHYYFSGGALSDPVTMLMNYVEEHPNVNSLVIYSESQQTLHMFYSNSFKTISVNAGTSYVPDSMNLDTNTFISTPNIWLKEAVQLSDKPMYSINIPIKNKASMQKIGKICVFLESEGINKALTDYEDQLIGNVVVLSNTNDVLYDTSQAYYGSKYPHIDQLSILAEADQTNPDGLIRMLTDSKHGFTVLSVMSQEELDSLTDSVERLIIIVSLACIGSAILISTLYMNSLARRTHRIIKFTQKVKSGDLSARIYDRHDDGLGLIANRFNEMLDELNRHIDRVYKAEIKQKYTELAVLESRVNPHFLYNTLEVIRMKAVIQGIPEVSEMIFCLSALFRGYVKQKDNYTLADELEATHLYLKLFQIRYTEKFTYEIRCDKRFMSRPILKMSLQPLVENYVLHGIHLDRSDNRISIVVTATEQELKVEIKDNGSGIEADKLASIHNYLEHPQISSDSFGVRSIHERLQLLYGDSYGVDIQSELDHGTEVTVRFPVLGSEGGEDV